MYCLQNTTEHEIEFDLDGKTVTLKDGEEIELKELPALSDVICYNETEERLNYSNGYITHNGLHVLQIYLG